MSKIVTISREFGSGGRKLGRRFAKRLRFYME
ncbi:cytidylate kinase family protein [Anaerotignum sp.]